MPVYNSAGCLLVSMVGGAGGDGYNIISAGTQSGASAGTIVFSNSNNVSFGMSNSSIVTASATMAQSTQPVAVSGSNGSFLFSTMTLGSSNGLHFYSTNGSIVGSYTVPTQSTQPVAVSGSNGSFTFSTLTLGSSNGMHFYTTNGSVVGSYTVPTQSNQTMGIYLSSQTTGAASSTTIDARSFTIAGMGNISVGASAGSIVLSGSGGAGGGIAASANGSSVSAGTVVWSNSNNVSFGMNVSTITASATFAQSNQAGSVYAADSTFGTSSGTYDARTLSIRGSGLVSVAASNSGFIVQVAPARSLYASSNTFGTSSGTYDARTLSIAGSGLVSVAASNSGWVISVPTTQQRSLYASSNTFGTSSGTYNDGTLSIAGSGAVSVAASNSGWVISAPTQTNQTVGLYAVGSTTLSSSATADARSLSFYGSGNIYVAATNGSVLIAQTGGAGGDGFNIIQMSGGNSYGTANTYASATMALYAAANISLSQSSNTISIIGPSPGGGSTLRLYMDFPIQGTSGLAVMGSTSHVRPVRFDNAYSFDWLRFPISMSAVSTTHSVSGGAGAFTASNVSTCYVVLYTKATGASSASLTSIASGSAGWTHLKSITMNTSSTNTSRTYTVSHFWTYPFGSGTTTTSQSTTGAGVSLSIATGPMSDFNGIRLCDLSFPTTVPPGAYWMAIGWSANTGSQSFSAATGGRITHAHVGITQPSAALGFPGQATNSSVQWQLGLGSFTTNAVGTTAGIPLSRISSSASQYILPFQGMANW